MLDIQGARLGDAGAYALAAVVTANTTLTELNASYNDITEVGAAVLCKALERSHLQRLYLRGNCIGVGGATALSRVIRRTRHLCYIDVSNCSLRVRGVHALTDALIQRAQARMAKRLLQEAGAMAGGAWGFDAGGGPQTPFLAHAHVPAASNGGGSREAAGFGWLLGDPQHLLVTQNSTLRTDWGSLAAALRSSLRRAGGRGGSRRADDFSPARGEAVLSATSGTRRSSTAAEGASSTQGGVRRRHLQQPHRPLAGRLVQPGAVAAAEDDAHGAIGAGAGADAERTPGAQLHHDLGPDAPGARTHLHTAGATTSGNGGVGTPGLLIDDDDKLDIEIKVRLACNCSHRHY